jgi:hypothetical protein
MKRRSFEQGQSLLETVLMLPFLLLLLVGTVELGKIVYTYFALQKALYSIARLAGTQQGINLCDPGDPILTQTVNIVLTGTSSGDGMPLIQGLTPNDIQVRVERYDPAGNALTQCACSILGCDTSSGGAPPDFLVVSLVNGYQVSPVFPLFAVDPFPLRPEIRIPYGGT